ncbi:hypothetical protein [Chrysodeixis includens nucleopolyhedrovirus]|uniref:Ac78 n=1 Tax=Chrysodeixis includens nucleopolyhedrovirus TaxID=1207438 RepID=A0A5B8YSB4_9ABAC|nr:hypothetical protein QKU06_gp065 [Chrysodeixis includens nucleopolyhedrovirus]QED40593.1 hypothetical protein [Chrysodeixis includens nucleopolyhedrovirus]
MNLDVPYQRLPPTLRVQYVPLKLALNDNESKDKENADSNKTDKSKSKQLFYKEGDNFDYQTLNGNDKQFIDIVLVVLLSLFCVLVLLYAIYYFIIIRDQKKPTNFDSLPYRFFE